MLRPVVALATASLIFVLTCLSAWLSMSGKPEMTFGTRVVYRTHNMRWIAGNLLESAPRNGYPSSLEAIKESFRKKGASAEVIEQTFTDPWGNPYQYQQTGNGFQLFSLGRTGKPGGTGLDAEIQYDGHVMNWPTPSLSQFLFETEASRTLISVAIVASCSAALIWYVRARPSQGRQVSNLKAFGTAATVTVSAVVVAVFLSAIYCLTAQSGH
ncbi:MAG: type II secretion system protein GspG [Thermoguttaceae bacterium]